jgi:hypothetical protein
MTATSNDPRSPLTCHCTRERLVGFDGWPRRTGRTFAELKGEFTFDAVPTDRYAGNSVWQQLPMLAHNLTVGFRLQRFGLAEPCWP